ncbi:glycosyltransferase family 2 protein, partial [Faecalicatena contorta]|uniref:glycosyltransferase family 2 protein n=1 Tax=Faecalicatena contorta TaxID=39482 RepID=UPI001F22B44E
MRPKISVIIPVYKVEKYIQHCVDSILNQTLQDIEVILIEDGSPDLCSEICDAYRQQDHRVTVVHKKNSGVSAARNIGLNIASGEYIGFVDADDIVSNCMFEMLYTQAIRLNADICMCSYK